MQITTKRNSDLFIINFIIILTSVLSSLYIAYDVNIVQGYELLYLLPLVFGICFVFLLSKPLIVSKSIFLWTFMMFAILRYLALPTLMVYQRYYTGYAYYPPHSSSIQKGIFLMVYEVIISSILIRSIYKKYLCSPDIFLEEDTKKNKYSIKNKIVYLAFIFFVIFILIIQPQILKEISFFSNFNRISAEQGNISTSLGIQFFMLGKLLFYFLIIDKLHYKYLKSKKRRYIWLTYIVSFLNIGIFVGTNRKRILMNAIASIFTINYLYPKQKKKSSIIMLLLAFIIFFQLTVFRFYSNTDRKPFDNMAGTLQVYLSGPYNMALAVETREEYKEDISGFNVIYDIARPFYGIGQFFKRFDTYSSTEYFNKRLSIGGPLRSDQIMPMTGQGLLHFGFILSPIYLILSILLGFYTERKLSETKSFEKLYILVLICTMLGQMMGVNFIIIINFITYQGVLFYLVYWLNSKIKV